jgi:hypothetical protein
MVLLPSVIPNLKFALQECSLHQFKSCPEYQRYGALLIVEWLILRVRKCFPHRCRHIGGINSINKPQLTGDKGSNRNSFLCIISWLWTSNITPIGNFLPHLVTKRLLQLCHSRVDGYKPTSPAYWSLYTQLIH